MTIVFDATTTGPGPWTHALLIGVGYYDNIAQALPNLPQELARLPQLPEAVLSIREVADLLIEARAEFEPALGTVELLMSDPGQAPATYRSPHDGVVHQLDSPTLVQTTRSYLAWDQRLASEHDLALFYYCGHGFLASNPVLLLADVATNPNDPFVQAIDLHGFHLNMKACRASTQIFLADACQKIAHTILGRIAASRGTTLAGGSAHGWRRRDALRIDATAPGQTAWANAGQVTLFTGAVTAALQDRGAEQQPDGSWHITLAGLAKAVGVELAREIRNGAPYQHPVPQTEGNAATAIRKLAGTPAVPVEVECTPEVAIQTADVTIEEPSGVIHRRRAQSNSLVWAESVDPDTYLAKAIFADPNSRYRPRTVKGICIPPRKDFKLDVQ